jgi:hypothetical protein
MEQAQAHRALGEAFGITGDDVLSHEHQQSALAIEQQIS